jgi:hypothetical protein
MAKTIILGVVILLILYFIIRYMTVKPNLSGLEDATKKVIVDKDDLDSDDDSSVSNFTYSIWFNITNWNYRYGQPKIIFGRVNRRKQPCPSVVLNPIQNNLTISLACYPAPQDATQNVKSVIHKCEVVNIPIQKWVNLIMSVYGKSMDIYIDGKLVKTCILPGTAQVNKASDVYITPLGGFSGNTAKLQYWDKSTNPQQAWNIYKQGWGGGLSIFDKYKVVVSFYEDDEKQDDFTIG